MDKTAYSTDHQPSANGFLDFFPEHTKLQMNIERFDLRLDATNAQVPKRKRTEPTVSSKFRKSEFCFRVKWRCSMTVITLL